MVRHFIAFYELLDLTELAAASLRFGTIPGAKTTGKQSRLRWKGPEVGPARRDEDRKDMMGGSQQSINTRETRQHYCAAVCVSILAPSVSNYYLLIPAPVQYLPQVKFFCYRAGPARPTPMCW
jgi:hypothetical protein